MSGYFRAPEATRRVFRDGWLRTGDLAWADPDGYLWFGGTIKPIANLSGNKVDLVEVRRVIESCEGVVAVEMSLRRSDDPLPRVRLAAKVRARVGVDAEKIRAHCRARLARYKVPQDVELERHR
jgi:acyl-CoA synthetase (AMP-forming)/AMP-acid ligase II